MAFAGDFVVYNEEEDLDDENDYDETLDAPPNVIDDGDDDVDDDGSASSSNLAADPLPQSSVHPPTPSSSSKPSPGVVTIAVAGVSNGPFRPDLKRQRIEDGVRVATSEEKKPFAGWDESRKLFQRLWTDEDEIELLQGFLQYTTQRGATNSSHHHHDTAVFYDQIKSKLQLDFNKSQLVEKLRRLKKKYRTVASKMVDGKEYVFKSTHDQATFEISRKIWSNTDSAVRGTPTAAVDDGAYDDLDATNPSHTPNFLEQIANYTPNGTDSKTPSKSRKRSAGAPITPKLEEKQTLLPPQLCHPPNPTPAATATAAPPSPKANASSTPPFKAVTLTPAATPQITGPSIPGLIEETMKSCLSPILKELMTNHSGSRGFGFGLGLPAFSPMSLGFGINSTMSPDKLMADKWRRQEMLELEVYSRRLELVQDQIKEQLEQLRSMGG
ncbi:unnamed protein product [Cuscuta campestris]|uniref:Glabrous enhancer-binding protein-like DBD domain-containing protein n=1 Tax=Cuscuta campestris TaxID=132261 RepID=A0A484KE64_9ASTE|nr:unnamed protein product [Cuscuta campestris]